MRMAIVLADASLAGKVRAGTATAFAGFNS